MKARSTERILLLAIMGVSLLLIMGLSKEKIKSSEVKSDTFIIENIATLNEKNQKDVKGLFGKEKSIHKDKVFTYEDSLARYDILIVDEVKNATITLKRSMTIEEVLSSMDIKGDVEKLVEKNDKVLYGVYDKNKNVTANIEEDNIGQVRTVKIVYS